MYRLEHSELKQRRDEDQKVLPTYQSLLFDLLTRCDPARCEYPRVNTVPNLAFDLVTRRDLIYSGWSVHTDVGENGRRERKVGCSCIAWP